MSLDHFSIVYISIIRVPAVCPIMSDKQKEKGYLNPLWNQIAFVLGTISFRILLSFCCHVLSKFACIPHKYWVSGSCCITPTRSLEARLKHICLENMLRAILALYVLHRIGAIRFIVAMMLP